MWTIHNSSKEAKGKSRLTPGDYQISDDGRAVYWTDKNGSLRRVKDPEVVKPVQARFQELKSEQDRQAADAKLQEENPLTHPGGNKMVEAVQDLKTIAQVLDNRHTLNPQAFAYQGRVAPPSAAGLPVGLI